MLNKLQRWILTLCPHSEKSLGPPHHEGFSLGNLSLTCHFISSHQQEHFQVKRQTAKDTCPGSQYRDRAGTQTPRVYVNLKPVLSAPLELMFPREQHTVTLTQGVHSADIWGFRSLRVEQNCCFSSKIGKKIKIVNAYQPLPLGIYMKTELPALGCMERLRPLEEQQILKIIYMWKLQTWEAQRERNKWRAIKRQDPKSPSKLFRETSSWDALHSAPNSFPGCHERKAEGPPDAPELGSGCEWLMLGDGKHEEEALPTPEVVVANGRVVLLSGCVQDVYLDLLPVQDHLLPVTVSLGRFIVLHELGKRTTRLAGSKVLRQRTAAKTISIYGCFAYHQPRLYWALTTITPRVRH